MQEIVLFLQVCDNIKEEISRNEIIKEKLQFINNGLRLPHSG